MDESISNLIDLVIEMSSKLSAGEEKEFECPECGGKLLIEKSSYNGHLHAYCEGCQFVLME